MRTLAILLLAFCVDAAASAQQTKLFSVRQILHTLPGRWVMESQPDASGKSTYDCAKGPVLRIRFETGPTTVTYISSFEGEPDSEARSIVQARSDNNDVDKPGAIVLKYEGETRLDDAGKPVVWHLLMTNRDTFYWHREDWPNGETTPPSHRCPETSAVG